MRPKKMGEKPLVSVVTVVYNGANTLEQTILSVVDQTYKEIEYIVIDGGSTDGTIDLIKKYSRKIKYWISEEDEGIYDAMNKGIQKCTGTLIGIINSDDWYEPDAIQNVVKSFLDNEKKPAIYYGFLRILKNDIEYSIRRFHHNFYYEHMIQHPTWFVSRSLYEEYGSYNKNFRIAGDFELLQRFAQRSVDFIPIDRIISNFRLGGASNNLGMIGALEYLNLKYRFGRISKSKYYRKKFYLWLKWKLIKTINFKYNFNWKSLTRR